MTSGRQHIVHSAAQTSITITFIPHVIVGSTEHDWSGVQYYDVTSHQTSQVNERGLYDVTAVMLWSPML